MVDSVKRILSWYGSETPGTRSKIARMLMTGALAGTGRMIILPVDQGFEHGPDRSFAIQPDGYDPLYHARLAIDAKLSAFAAPLGMIELVADACPDQIPLILKVNSSTSWSRLKDQAVTASVDDALRLGCVGIGFTIYPGSDDQFNMFEEIRDIAAEAKRKGLVVVIWSYPRGPEMDKKAEQALDVTAYAAHLAALLGAHIIKVKPPTSHLAQAEAKDAMQGVPVSTWEPKQRFAHIVQSCFAGQRLVVFSGGATKSEADLITETKAIRDGGGNGSIVGRNTFQRSRDDAMTLLQKMIAVYKA